MTELEPIIARIEERHDFVVPLTGELVDLTNPTQLAGALDSVRDAKRLLDEARALLEGALVLEAARQGAGKTMHLPDGRDVVITGGETVEWDAERLEQQLRAAGLPEERVRDVVQETVTYKVSAREAKRVGSLNPRYAAIVTSCRSERPAPWHAYVK